MAPVRTVLREAARTLATDAATGEAVAALRERGIPTVVLRGPAVARQLYEDGELREYVDADLLVPPASRRGAAETLARLGFVPLATEGELARHRPPHAVAWQRERDRVWIDLHRTVSGCAAPDEEVWRVLAEASEPTVVAGVQVAAPKPAALAVIVSLHAAHTGPRGQKPLADLDRALLRLDTATWSEAGELARRLDALPALAAGLRLRPAGAEVAARLGLPDVLPVDVALRASGAPPLALGFEWLGRTQGLGSKAALALHVIAPPPGALRSWRSLARRGRSGLAAAYVSHPFWLAKHAVPSLRALQRARRAAA